MEKTQVFLFLALFKTLVANDVTEWDYYHFKCPKYIRDGILDGARLYCSDRGGFTIHETETRPLNIFQKCCLKPCHNYDEYCRLSLDDIKVY